MSRTEEQYRIKKADRQGALAASYGDPITANPWRGSETRAAWERGWSRIMAQQKNSENSAEST